LFGFINMKGPVVNFLLFDCPSEHEIELNLITEGELIESILGNRRTGRNDVPKSNLRRLRIVSSNRINNAAGSRYKPHFVHLGGHAEKCSLNLIGGKVAWWDVAEMITSRLAKLPAISPLKSLRSASQRSIVFSCCHSSCAFRMTKDCLKGYFSGAYYFKEENVNFSDTLAVWAMFYSQIGDYQPHSDEEEENIVAKINKFMGKEVLIFKRYPIS